MLMMVLPRRASAPAADPRVVSLAAEFGLRLVSMNTRPSAGETRAFRTICQIVDRHGEAHARLVLSTIMETERNHGCVDDALLWAVSDLVRACSHIIEKRTSDWLAFWDALPLAHLQLLARQLTRHIKTRYALAGMIYERFFRVFLAKHPLRPKERIRMMGRALDIGWCVVAPLDDNGVAFVSKYPDRAQHDRLHATTIGLSLRGYRNLPAEKREEVEYAVRFITFAFGEPSIGKAIAA